MPPYLLLSMLIGAIFGTLFYLWRGKTWRDLPIYLLTGIIGFGLGQAAGLLLGLNMVMVGPLHLIEATVVSWGSLFLMRWLKI
jgi:hypothetical protein